MPNVVTDPFSQTSVFIKMKFGETELAAGTAFFYRRNGELYLVSNWHNLSGRNPETKQPLSSHGGVPDRISCYVCLNEPYIKRAWLDLPLVVDDKANWFEHPTHGGGIDIGVLPIDTHPAQLVTKRRAIFKEFTRTLEPMGMVARDRKDYSPREVYISALALEKLATQPWGHFTPDSNYPPTHATPAVWTQPAEFKYAQQNYQAAVTQLVKAAEGGDLGIVRTAVNDVQHSCKTCHNQFRKAY